MDSSRMQDYILCFVIPTIALLLLLFLLFLLLLFFLTICARFMVHSSPSAVQAQHSTVENANDCSEKYGQPKHYEQDSQDRGPDPESLRIENDITELNCSIGEDALFEY